MRTSKCGVHCDRSGDCDVVAGELGVQAKPDGVVVLGTPIGERRFVERTLNAQAAGICATVDKLMAMPLGHQSQFTLLRCSQALRMLHLQRTVRWPLLAAPTRRLEQRILSAVAAIFRLPLAAGPTGAALPSGPEVSQLTLPIRYGGFGIRATSALQADAAFLSGAAAAQAAMQTGPVAFRPFEESNGLLPMLKQCWERVFANAAGPCGWDASKRAISADVVRSLFPDLQRDVGAMESGKPADRLFNSASLETRVGRRMAARLCSCRGPFAGAWLTALPARSTALGDTAFMFAGRHRLGLGAPSSVPCPPCFCGADNTGSPDHAMVCRTVAKATQMRHNQLALAVRRVASRASCPSSMEPSYRGLQRSETVNSAGQRRGDIFAIMPDATSVVVDTVLTHPCADSYVAQAAKEDGYAAKRAADVKIRRFRGLREGAQHDFVPFAVESYGRLHGQAVAFVKRLGDAACESGPISKTAFVASAFREISCAVQAANAVMYSQSVVALARAAGRSFVPGCEAPLEHSHDL